LWQKSGNRQVRRLSFGKVGRRTHPPRNGMPPEAFPTDFLEKNRISGKRRINFPMPGFPLQNAAPASYFATPPQKQKRFKNKKPPQIGAAYTFLKIEELDFILSIRIKIPASIAGRDCSSRIRRRRWPPPFHSAQAGPASEVRPRGRRARSTGRH